MNSEEILLDKKQVIASLSELPDQVSSEELIERILFIKLIESRLRETTHIPHQQVMQELKDLKLQKIGPSNETFMIDWKESAREEVRDVYTNLLNLSLAAADDWSDQLEKKLNLIEQFPGMGRMVPDYYISFIREVFVGSYRLVYSTQTDIPVVLAVRPMGRPLGRI